MRKASFVFKLVSKCPAYLINMHNTALYLSVGYGFLFPLFWASDVHLMCNHSVSIRNKRTKKLMNISHITWKKKIFWKGLFFKMHFIAKNNMKFNWSIIIYFIRYITSFTSNHHNEIYFPILLQKLWNIHLLK